MADREVEPDETAVWVKTEMALDDSGFVVTLEASDDNARVLTAQDALNYASAVLSAAQRAEYDAAVIAQMTQKLKIPILDALALVKELRADRAPIDDSHTFPLRLVPGVSHLDQRGFIQVWLGDVQLGQWELAQTRDHALRVLESVGVADLDFGFYRHLVSGYDIDKNRALQVIEDLGNYR